MTIKPDFFEKLKKGNLDEDFNELKRLLDKLEKSLKTHEQENKNEGH